MEIINGMKKKINWKYYLFDMWILFLKIHLMELPFLFGIILFLVLLMIILELYVRVDGMCEVCSILGQGQ